MVATGVNIPLGIALMAVGAVGLASNNRCELEQKSNRLARTLSLLTKVLRLSVSSRCNLNVLAWKMFLPRWIDDCVSSCAGTAVAIN